MKKTLHIIFIFLFVFVAMQSHAQNCEPNPMYADTTVGVYPLPDPVNSPTSSLNSGCVDVGYQQLFTAVVPDSIFYVEFNGNFVDLALFSVLVDSIVGLPPGITYACEPPNCLFEQLTIGCVLFSGTPIQEGLYEPVVYTTTSVNIGVDLTLSVNFPSQPDDIIKVFPGEYKINICTYNNCLNDCTIISTEDAFAEAVGLRQNIPNPFSTTTSITIDTQLSGDFDFKVFNLTGKTVHQEQVTLITGKNIITFDGSQLQSGIYLYTIGQGNNIATNRMIISK